MANLKNVIYLSNEDYETLISTGTVTIDGETLTYDENNLYITPNALASSTEDGLMSAEDKVKLDGLNIENGTGTKAVQMKQDVTTIDYTGRNSNATTIDSTITGTVSIGAIGSQTSTLGKQTIATGSQSMAIGNKSWAKGDESLAQGYQCVTLGAGSHAEGQQTVSYGDLSHAEGLNTVAEGKASHTEGENTRTKANYIEVTTGGAPTPDPTPIPSQSDEEKDVGNGWYAHAEGIESLAFAIGSRASGYSAKAYSRFGTANGINVVTGQLVKRKTEGNIDYYTVDHNIEAASAFGYYTKAQYPHQFVVGSFNDNQSNTVFEVGNGSNESDRRNALTAYTDGHVEVGLMGDTELSVATKAYVDANAGGGGEIKRYMHRIKISGITSYDIGVESFDMTPATNITEALALMVRKSYRISAVSTSMSGIGWRNDALMIVSSGGVSVTIYYLSGSSLAQLGSINPGSTFISDTVIEMA